MGRGPAAPAPGKADAQKPAALRSHRVAASPSAAGGSSPPNHGPGGGRCGSEVA